VSNVEKLAKTLLKIYIGGHTRPKIEVYTKKLSQIGEVKPDVLNLGPHYMCK
jgi:hypothetical protein